MIKKAKLLETLLLGAFFTANNLFHGVANAEEFLREKYRFVIGGQKKELVVSGNLTGNDLTIKLTQETDKKYFSELSEREAKKAYSRRIITGNLAEIRDLGTRLAIVSSPETKIKPGRQTVWAMPDREEVTAVPYDKNFPKRVLFEGGKTAIVIGGKITGVHEILTILAERGLDFAKGASEERARKNLEELTRIGDAKVTLIENNHPREWKSSAIYERVYNLTLEKEKGAPTPYLVARVAISDEHGGARITPVIMKKIPLKKRPVPSRQVDDFDARMAPPFGQVNYFDTTLTKMEIRDNVISVIKKGEREKVIWVLYDFETGKKKFITEKQADYRKGDVGNIPEKEKKEIRKHEIIIRYCEGGNPEYSFPTQEAFSWPEIKEYCFDTIKEVPKQILNRFGLFYTLQQEGNYIHETDQGNYFASCMRRLRNENKIRYKRLPQPSENQGR